VMVKRDGGDIFRGLREKGRVATVEMRGVA
jgi:hypothetical protein